MKLPKTFRNETKPCTENKEGEKGMIREFRGKYLFLSNFYEGKVFEYKGMKFTNTEAAFHSQKCLSMQKQFEMMRPSQSKQLGRKVPLRPDWNKIRTQIMHDVCYAKFTQDEELKRKLLATGDKYLEEGNYHGDKFWGTTYSKRERQWIGENNLGKILMQLRKELREK